MGKVSIGRRIQRRVLVLRCIECLMDRILTSCLGKSVSYRMFPHSGPLSNTSPSSSAHGNNALPSSSASGSNSGYATPENHSGPLISAEHVCHNDVNDSDSDLVPLKITLLGDPDIGKSSFLAKYAGEGKALGERSEGKVDKTLVVGGARISYTIWEVGGDNKSEEQLFDACKGSVAIFIMFDLTSRCTLNNVIEWYQQARRLNQGAIPVLIGTKFDDFIQLPIDLQWTISSQARAYAKALNATLFFSSSAYNINVNKIFKFVTAKIFDLPWNLERNVTLGEPIIDF